MQQGRLLLYLLLIVGAVMVSGEYSYGLEHTLREKLFDNYNIFTRPREIVNVSVALNIMTLIDLDISKQSFSFAAYFTMKWTDQRLEWSSHTNYSDIRYIYSNQENVWRPLLIIENSISDISVFSDEQIPMKINRHGTVHWNPSGVYQTFCKSDVTYFPYDTQTCKVILTTWGYTDQEINLIGKKVKTIYFMSNGEWTLRKTRTIRSTNRREDDSIQEVIFLLTFRRRPSFEMINNISPMILIALLGPFIFKVPPQSGEKIGYTLTVLLSYTVYLTMVTATMPSTSYTTSILAIYLLLIMIIGVVTVLITVFVLYCHQSETRDPVPKWLQKMAKCMDKISCRKVLRSLQSNKATTVNHEKETDDSNRMQSIRLTGINRHVSGKHNSLSPEEVKNITGGDNPELLGNTITWQNVGGSVDAFCFRVVFSLVVMLSVLLIIVLSAHHNAN